MLRKLLVPFALLAACQTPDTDAPPRPRAAPEAAPARAAPIDLLGSAGDCAGEVVTRGGERFLQLDDGSLLTRAPLAVRAAGGPRTFHPQNFAGGAVQHRCNAGEVHLPGGTRYMGGRNEATCERFEQDAARIEAAGWDDGTVGAIRWFGIDAEGSARVGGAVVPRVRPVLTPEGGYVSRTPLRDETRPLGDPGAYPDATRDAYAAARRDQDIALGSHGVAWRTRACPPGRACEPVPFVVAARSARAGEGSVALARAASGLEPAGALTRRDRYRGQAENADLLYVFFGGAGAPFRAETGEADAAAAFAAWGGRERLIACRRAFIPEARAEATR